jgi:hypothetical protein
MSSALSSSICYAVVALIVVFSSRGRLYERVRQQQVRPRLSLVASGE